MANYNKAKYYKVKQDEIKHAKAKEVAERTGLIEYGTTDKDKLKFWKEKKVAYEDISCYAEGNGECYKYGNGRNTKYYYRTPIYTPFTHSVDHYTYGIFTQEPSERELEVLLMGGESVKYDSKDVAAHVGKKLFKQIFGFNLPTFNFKNLFQEEEKEEDMKTTLSNFLGHEVEFGQFIPKQEQEVIEECRTKDKTDKIEKIDFEYDEKTISSMIDEKDYMNAIKQLDHFEYERQELIMKF